MPPLQTSTNRELSLILTDLRMTCEEVSLACNAPSPLHKVRAAAYELAKATKTLVTHFQPPS